MKTLKPIRTIIRTIFASALCLMALCLTSLADTAPLQLIYNTGITGKASVVRVVVTDSAGNVLLTATNTPDGTHAFAESGVISGEYYAPYTVTYSAANLPLRAEFYTSDASITAAVATYLSERGASASAGYTASLPGQISATNKAVVLATGTVGSSPTTTVIPSNLSTSAGDIYSGDELTWLTGPNAGKASHVASWFSMGSTLTLASALPNTPTAGDTFSLSPYGKGLVLLTTGGISGTTGQVIVGTNNDKAGYTVSTVQDKSGYSLSGSQTFSTTGTFGGLTGITFPSNFSALSIDGTGRIALSGSEHTAIGADVQSGLTAQGLTTNAISKIILQLAQIDDGEWGSITKNPNGTYTVQKIDNTGARATITQVYDGTGRLVSKTVTGLN